MTEDPGHGVFQVRAQFDCPELLGARWWQEQVAAAAAAGDATAVSRRETLQRLLLIAGGVTIAGVAYFSLRQPSRRRDSGLTRNVDLQRQQGWDVDASLERLRFPHAVDADVDGARVDRTHLAGLVEALTPPSRWQPWYVPTLLQSVAGHGQDAQDDILPICSPAMRAAFAAGEALRRLIAAVGDPRDIALVIDLAGPESVAFAAGVREAFAPVLTFDNWPHPRGVVPAHLTLGAVCYHAPHLRSRAYPSSRPPAFVLDRARLDPYRNEPARFDNRYVVSLPNAAHLEDAGIRRVLMVVPTAVTERRETTELDDLNDTCNAWRERGLEVRLLALDSFLPAAGARPSASPAGSGERQYLGRPGGSYWFWNHYGWHAAPGPRPNEPDVGRPPGARYEPTPRNTASSLGPRIGMAPQRSRSQGRSSGGSWGRSSGWSGVS